MRSPQLLLLIPILAFVAYFVYDTNAHEPPTGAASKFLQTLQAGDVEGALREFGDNTCHCAPEGGYVSYLQPESGYDPNLSFLLGKKFAEVGAMKTEALPYNGEKYLMPWDKPEDALVYVTLEFPEGERPYFLPLDMAYGYEMKDADVKAFEAAPDKEWKKAFTLRLRSTLKPGVISERDPRAKQTQMERMAKDGLLPKEYLRYIHPKDAAGVKVGDKTEPAESVAKDLPRLKTISIGLKVVRRGALTRWAVKKAGFTDPVLVMPDGKDLALK